MSDTTYIQWRSISTESALKQCAFEKLNEQLVRRYSRATVATDPNVAAELATPTAMQAAFAKAVSR
jgi:hypothetical protein